MIYKISYKQFITGVFLMAIMFPVRAMPQELLPLQLKIEGIDERGFIEPQYAYCIPAVQGHKAPGQNVNLGVQWGTGPKGTRSYALIMVDKDVPADFSNANKEGVAIPVSQPRRDFYHWVMVDIPATVTHIPAGEESKGLAPKPTGASFYGVRGINDFSSNKEIHGGYDGPCPPWNDEQVHNYHIMVYALNTERLENAAGLTGGEALNAIRPHVLASGEMVGKYTLNSRLIENK